MTILMWIIAASFLGGALSVLTASVFAYAAKPHWVGHLVSYAIGALLGAAFLEILPHALETGNAHTITATVLAGIMGFFVLEKLVLWRHCHHESCEAHTPEHGHSHNHNHGHQAVQVNDHGRSGMMILVGDTFHNFVDGILIAAAFLADVQLGIITALAIITHEIPQEVGDFLILLHSGYSKARALAYNLLSSGATLVGGVLAYYALHSMQNMIPVFLALAAASMIYVAVADLIPGLHKRVGLAATLEQAGLIAAGIATIWISEMLVGKYA
jgi:zinc and cadmium transporter